MARAAPEAAIGWLRRALAEAAPEPPRAVLLHELGQVEAFGRDPAAIGHLQQALELAPEPVLRARVARDLYDMLVATGQWDAAVRVTSAALDELGDRDPELAVDLEVNRATARAYDPRLVADFDRDRERLQALAAGESWGARALSVLLAAVAACRGEDLDQVRPLVEHGLRDGRLLAERGAGGAASAQALGALVSAEADDRALEVVEELTAQARRSGALIGTLTAIGMRGWISARRGDLAAAEADLRTCLDVSTQNGLALISANAFLFFAETIQERPSLDDVAALVETLELAPDFLPTLTGSMLLEARGRLRLARGERQGALADLRSCAATNRALGFGPTWTSWRSALALALPAEARDEALAMAEEEVALAATTGLARPRAVALRTVGLLRGDEHGLACLRKSVALLEDSPARLEHARSLVELGAALRRRGQRAQAREPLAAGMERAHRCGAERLAARAREDLHATGARPRRLARTGVDALTASEQRMVRLAAEGRSNSQLAQELFVSMKTVETHLSHAYAKLGLSGPGARRHLVAALERAHP
jgi:ATP/maltotriose-dependent transcriptional regulator MalT